MDTHYDEFYISAKPFLVSVNNHIVYYDLKFPDIQNLDFLIRCKQLFNIRNVYLSANNPTMFSGLSYYDIFSSIEKLSADNPPFNAVKIYNYVYNDHYLAFSFPSLPQINGIVNVIIENEAGYGNLIDGAINSISHEYDGIEHYLLNPSISGIQVFII